MAPACAVRKNCLNRSTRSAFPSQRGSPRVRTRRRVRSSAEARDVREPSARWLRLLPRTGRGWLRLRRVAVAGAGGGGGRRSVRRRGIEPRGGWRFVRRRQTRSSGDPDVRRRRAGDGRRGSVRSGIEPGPGGRGSVRGSIEPCPGGRGSVRSCIEPGPSGWSFWCGRLGRGRPDLQRRAGDWRHRSLRRHRGFWTRSVFWVARARRRRLVRGIRARRGRRLVWRSLDASHRRQQLVRGGAGVDARAGQRRSVRGSADGSAGRSARHAPAAGHHAGNRGRPASEALHAVGRARAALAAAAPSAGGEDCLRAGGFQDPRRRVASAGRRRAERRGRRWRAASRAGALGESRERRLETARDAALERQRAAGGFAGGGGGHPARRRARARQTHAGARS